MGRGQTPIMQAGVQRFLPSSASIHGALLLGALTLGLCAALPAQADPAPFDLPGPALRVSVTRQGVSLPIDQVPQLAAGDKVAVEALLPKDQAAHYLLVAAFLRGPTNPPPDKWFSRSMTWKGPKKGGGPLPLTVPDGARQLVLFLAPETGGDFSTLRGAVQGRPGAFVRAGQDLLQASLDRRRLDTYLAAIREAAQTPGQLAHVAPVLAASLHIKINNDCLNRLPELQAACLTENRESLVLDEDHGNATAETLTGAGADLALQISATPSGGLGYYSPYISAMREIIGIFGAMHTAQYQYIPALSLLRDDRMTLVLNMPPSFHNPKSVLVVALPAVGVAQLPALQLPNPAPVLCAEAGEQWLPASGAPLLYATRYARDMVLRVPLPDGRFAELDARADAAKGGLEIGHLAKGNLAKGGGSTALPGGLKGPLVGRLHGLWGFDPFDGPSVSLETPGAWQWQAAPENKGAGGSALVLKGAASACVTGITAQAEHGEAQAATWKATGPDEIAVTLPPLPSGTRPGPVTLTVNGPNGITPAKLTLIPPAQPPAFAAQLIALSAERPQASGNLAVQLGSPGEIPADATLRFSLRAQEDARFTGGETVEVATATGNAVARLTVANGLTIVDPRVALVSIEPGKALGPSAFGPLRARVVRKGTEGGGAGDWLPVGTLVRLPVLRQLQCPAASDAPCELAGDGLFLLGAVSDTPGFDHAVNVPDGYPGETLQVPRPASGFLYLRLHDAPEVVNRVPAGSAKAP